MPELSSHEIQLLNEFGEAEAWADYYHCAPQDFAQQFRLEAKRIGSVWVNLIAGLDWAFFNRIVGLGVKEVATRSMLDDAIAVLESAGCENYMAQLAPSAQGSELPEWLASRGFARGSQWAKVYRGNQPPAAVPTDVRIEQIGEDHADVFANVALAAFEMPPELKPFVRGHVCKPGWHHYVGFDGDMPVAASAMYVRDDIAWLGFGSTPDSHRKRGAQGAMFQRRIRDGLALGCKWFVSETGEDTAEDPNPSYHNMLRAGFQLAYLRPNYVHQAAPG